MTTSAPAQKPYTSDAISMYLKMLKEGIETNIEQATHPIIRGTGYTLIWAPTQRDIETTNEGRIKEHVEPMKRLLDRGTYGGAMAYRLLEGHVELLLRELPEAFRRSGRGQWNADNPPSADELEQRRKGWDDYLKGLERLRRCVSALETKFLTR